MGTKNFFKDSVGIYDKVNKERLDIYMVNNRPDGEIKFLAANPDIKVKGIGTYLLNGFEKRNKGKEFYLLMISVLISFMSIEILKELEKRS